MLKKLFYLTFFLLAILVISTINVQAETLHDVIFRDDISEIEEALEEADDIDELNFAGLTPLMSAIEMTNDLEVVELLIDAGADINYVSETTGSSPLLMALSNPSITTELISLLLDSGADPNPQNHGGYSVLSDAFFYDVDYEVFEELVLAGVELNEVDGEGGLPLNVAIYFTRTDLIELFLENGADPNIFDDYGYNALMEEVNYFEPDPKVVEMLLDAGADPNLYNEEGKTALMLAADMNNDIEVIKLLLTRDADPEIVDNQGNTAYNYFLDNYQLEDPGIESILAGDIDIDEYLAEEEARLEKLARVFDEMSDEDIEAIVDNFVNDMKETIHEGTDALEKHLGGRIVVDIDVYNRDEYLEIMQEPYHYDDLNADILEYSHYTDSGNIIISILLYEEFEGTAYEDEVELVLEKEQERWLLYEMRFMDPYF